MTASGFEDPLQDEPLRQAVLAKADDTGLGKVSEVKVFAIPLFHQGDLVQLVYLPVPAKESTSEPSKSYVPQKLRDYATKTQVCRTVHSTSYVCLLALPSRREMQASKDAGMLFLRARSSSPACGNSGVKSRRVSGAEFMTWVNVKLRTSALSHAY